MLVRADRDYRVTPLLSLLFLMPLTGDLVDDVADVHDARLLHLVQLSEQRRRLVDVLLRGVALTVAAK